MELSEWVGRMDAKYPGFYLVVGIYLFGFSFAVTVLILHEIGWPQ